MKPGQAARAFAKRLSDRLNPSEGSPLALRDAIGVALILAVLDIADAIRETSASE